MAKLRALKRSGCKAFRGSRVNLTELVEAIKAEQREPSLSGVLLSIVEEVARIVANKLPHEDARFRADSGKITETIHNGFACALIVVAPDEVDYFLPKSAALMENIFKSARKKTAASRSTRKGMAAKNHRNN
jgi:hypothetical protein